MVYSGAACSSLLRKSCKFGLKIPITVVAISLTVPILPSNIRATRVKRSKPCLLKTLNALLSSHEPFIAAIVGCQRHGDQLNLSTFLKDFPRGTVWYRLFC
jgi:hypothetical protein